MQTKLRTYEIIPNNNICFPIGTILGVEKLYDAPDRAQRRPGSLTWDIKMLKKVAGLMAGGLFNVKLEGAGMIAITTHYDPLTLKVTPENRCFPEDICGTEQW